MKLGVSLVVCVPVGVTVGEGVMEEVRERDSVDEGVGVLELEAPHESEGVWLALTVLVGVCVTVPVPVREGVGVMVDVALMPRTMSCAACMFATSVTASPATRKVPSLWTTLGCVVIAVAVDNSMLTPPAAAASCLWAGDVSSLNCCRAARMSAASGELVMSTAPLPLSSLKPKLAR